MIANPLQVAAFYCVPLGLFACGCASATYTSEGRSAYDTVPPAAHKYFIVEKEASGGDRIAFELDTCLVTMGADTVSNPWESDRLVVFWTGRAVCGETAGRAVSFSIPYAAVPFQGSLVQSPPAADACRKEFQFIVDMYTWDKTPAGPGRFRRVWRGMADMAEVDFQRDSKEYICAVMRKYTGRGPDAASGGTGSCL